MDDLIKPWKYTHKDTLLKFNSSPLKIDLPKKESNLPTIIFQGRAVKLHGRYPVSTGFRVLQNTGDVLSSCSLWQFHLDAVDGVVCWWTNLLQKWILIQWRFLVPLIGGRWHIITQLAVYTTYILPIGWLYATYRLLGEPEQPLMNSLQDSLVACYTPL